MYKSSTYLLVAFFSHLLNLYALGITISQPTFERTHTCPVFRGEEGELMQPGPSHNIFALVQLVVEIM
jgi:hypothetical protein